MCFHIHLQHMHVEAAHARLDAMQFRFSSARHPLCTPAQRRFALDGYARWLADTEPVASVTHWLPCKTVCLCHLPGDGSGVVHGWSGSGTGMERYGTVSGTKRPTPAQHCHCSASLSNSESAGGCSKQFLDCKLAAAKRISSIIQRSSATAGSNYQSYRRKPATG